MIEIGRPKKLSPKDEEEIRILNNGGEKQYSLACLYKVSLSTITRICKEKK